jgi:translation initiation factor IF-1
MNVYLFATVLGLVGLTSMAALGLSHGHSPGARGGHASSVHSHGGHAHSGAHLAQRGHSLGQHSPGQHGLQRGPHSSHASAHTSQGVWLNSLLMLTSPRVLLSALTGFGLSGLLLTGLTLTASLPGVDLLLLAVLGGLGFERLLIQPYWNALMNFQSRPAQSLSSAAFSPADAVTDFDASGNGLIALEFEGEVRQLLATLGERQRLHGVRVRRGDRLVIESIDEARNRCTVASLN